MKSTRRLFAVLITVVMVIGLLPVTVSADFTASAFMILSAVNNTVPAEPGCTMDFVFTIYSPENNDKEWEMNMYALYVDGSFPVDYQVNLNGDHIFKSGSSENITGKISIPLTEDMAKKDKLKVDFQYFGNEVNNYTNEIETNMTSVAVTLVPPEHHKITFKNGIAGNDPAPATTNAYGKLDSWPTPSPSANVFIFDKWADDNGNSIAADKVFDEDTDVYSNWFLSAVRLSIEAPVSGNKVADFGKKKVAFLTPVLSDGDNISISSVQWYIDGTDTPLADSYQFVSGETYKVELTIKLTDAHMNWSKDGCSGTINIGTSSVSADVDTSSKEATFKFSIPVGHSQHNWTYAVNGGTVTAKCTCDKYKKGLTLNLTAPEDCVEDNFQHAATLTDNISNVTGATVGSVNYFKSDDTALGTTPPVAAGSYKAKVTLSDGGNDYTAEVSFSISPKLYNISVNGGSATGMDGQITQATEGSTVNLEAASAPEGKVFDQWTVTAGNATLADATLPLTSFTMPAGDVGIKATYKDPELYGITSGADVTYVKGSDKEIRITCEGALNKFIEIQMTARRSGSITVPKNAVKYETGSTIAIFSSAFLETLSAGEYTICFIYTDGTSKLATLHIVNAPVDPGNPKTGDDSNMLLWVSMLIVSASGLAVLTFDSKRKKKRA